VSPINPSDTNIDDFMMKKVRTNCPLHNNYDSARIKSPKQELDYTKMQQGSEAIAAKFLWHLSQQMPILLPA
jgi:hypothetical protein